MEYYEQLTLNTLYNPHQLNQSLPIMHRELQKIFENKIPHYYTKTRWELYKEMKHRLDREYGMDPITVDENGKVIFQETEEILEDRPEKDPEEVVEEEQVSQENLQEKRVNNQFQTALTILTDEVQEIPTKKNQQVTAESIALDRIKHLNHVGWNRVESIKKHFENKEVYNRKAYRHESFCLREEMNQFLASKQDLDLSSMTEKERLSLFRSAKFDPAEQFRRDCRLWWLNNRKKFGFGYAPGEKKKNMIFDLSVLEEMMKSRDDIKETTSGIKEAYDDHVSQSGTSAYGGTTFLLSNTSKNTSMEKCLDYIRQYDKEFNLNDLEDYVKKTFERVYVAHLKGMLYEIDNICQEQASGYFKAVWNIWGTQKIRPKYSRVWGIERPVFSASEFNSSNQPVFNFSIHCQTNHCFVDSKDGNTVKEGSHEKVMRNGYQVVCIFDPTEENESDQWKIISIQPIEKTLLLA